MAATVAVTVPPLQFGSVTDTVAANVLLSFRMLNVVVAVQPVVVATKVAV